MGEESSSIDKVLSGEMKLEYIDQLELLKENLSSNSFLNNRSNKKDILKLVLNADNESSRLISESFVLQEAVVEANALVKQAEQEAILSRASVEDKLDNKLEEIKSKIDELSDIVEREKTNLRQPRKITEPE